jgi:hypothetical protein
VTWLRPWHLLWVSEVNMTNLGQCLSGDLNLVPPNTSQCYSSSHVACTTIWIFSVCSLLIFYIVDLCHSALLHVILALFIQEPGLRVSIAEIVGVKEGQKCMNRPKSWVFKLNLKLFNNVTQCLRVCPLF